jgi:hypothetical protein
MQISRAPGCVSFFAVAVGVAAYSGNRGAGEEHARIAVDLADAAKIAVDGPRLPSECWQRAWIVENGPVTPGGIRDLWVGGDDNIWAVGEGGAVVHFDGGAWNRHDLAADETITGVWGIGKESTFAVSERAVYRFDGTT